MNRIFSFIMALVFSTSIWAASYTVQSPNKLISAKVNFLKGEFWYSVNYGKKHVISDSRLGLLLQDGMDLSKGSMLEKVERKSKRNEWRQIWGQNRVVSNHHDEIHFYLNHHGFKFQLQFKVFNDGVGFRYLFPKQYGYSNIQVWDESTEFNFGRNDQAWWVPAMTVDRYEMIYRKTYVRDIKTAHTPFTIELANGLFASIHEAKLVNFASMSLENRGDGRLKSFLIPWIKTGMKASFNLPHETPWRTIQIANKAVGLLHSGLSLNLNDPPKAKDYSWVETGKYIGIWWGMHLGKYTWGSGPKLGANTQKTKEYIDFAAEHGFKGVLVEGWNEGWDGGWYDAGEHFLFDDPNPHYDIDYLTKYAQSKGVRLIGHHETGGSSKNYERQLERAYDYLNEKGMKAVKTGYVGSRLDRAEWHHGQYGVWHYNKAMRMGHKKKVMMVVHEPIKQTGLRRTYPNLMATEGSRGQEYDAWASDGGNPPDHTVVLPFTRLLAGPMDFTPGTFDLTFDQWRSNNRVNTTLAKQLALYVTMYSPWQMASDLPENYLHHPEAFEFIKNVPTDWEKSVGVDAKIGDYLVIARQEKGSSNWYLGAISDENGRKVTIKLDFLEKGAWYKVKAYQDARDASWSSNPYAMEFYETEVSSDGTFDLYLAPGGGLALEFIKK